VAPEGRLQGDRVRRHTAHEVLRRIDEATATSLTQCAVAGPQAIAQRMGELEREWDTDRVLETHAAAVGLLTLALAAAKPRLLVLPAVVALALMTQAFTGRYPLMPLFRRLGVRTAREIERERHALKALRGDFAGMAETGERAGQPAPAQPLAAPPRSDLH
jgi:hypothetical protein